MKRRQTFGSGVLVSASRGRLGAVLGFLDRMPDEPSDDGRALEAEQSSGRGFVAFGSAHGFHEVLAFAPRERRRQVDGQLGRQDVVRSLGGAFLDRLSHLRARDKIDFFGNLDHHLFGYAHLDLDHLVHGPARILSAPFADETDRPRQLAHPFFRGEEFDDEQLLSAWRAERVVQPYSRISHFLSFLARLLKVLRPDISAVRLTPQGS